MKISTIFFKNKLRNFCYIVSFNENNTYCIDPFSSSEVINAIGDTKIKAIINTHDHCDHSGGNLELLSKYGCEIMTHTFANVPGKSRSLENKEVIYEDDQWTLSALDTPGHTLSHLCIMLEKDKKPYAIFTGDCFFNAGVGNCHDGDVTKQYLTISQIFASFPDDLKIYPGHEYLKRNLEFCLSVESSNTEVQKYLNMLQNVNLDEVFFVNEMRVERDINCFLRLNSEVIRNHLNLIDNSNEEVFYTLRQLRNNW